MAEMKTYTQDEWEAENTRLRQLYAAERDELLRKQKEEHGAAAQKLTDAHADELKRRVDEAKVLAEKHVADLAERNRVIADTEEQGRLDVIAEAETLKQEISGLKNRLANLQSLFDSLKAAHDQALAAMARLGQIAGEAKAKVQSVVVDPIHAVLDTVAELSAGNELVKQRRRQELEATKAAADAELAKLDNG